MARTPRTSNPVSLFPFLAVLLCTIGALVLLLVVVASGIRKDAVATATKSEETGPAEPEADSSDTDTEVSGRRTESAEPPELVEVEKGSDRDEESIQPQPVPHPPESPIQAAGPAQLAEVSNLEKTARRLRSELETRRRRLKNIRTKKEALQQQLVQAATEHSRMQQALVRTIDTRAELAQRRNELKIENRQMIELLDQSRELISEEKKRLSSPKHSIIPYDGQTGTVRRPIIIECRDNVVRFEAEGVEIPYRDLKRFSPQQNPLRSGVQALAAYWSEHERQADPDRRPPRPYALILVRPSGADAFQSATFALDELVGDFGYELVEEDFDYELPGTTEEAVRVCRNAVEATLKAGPVRSRRELNPSGPVDIGRVTRAPVASRGFFASDDFRKRSTGGNRNRGTPSTSKGTRSRTASPAAISSGRTGSGRTGGIGSESDRSTSRSGNGRTGNDSAGNGGRADGRAGTDEAERGPLRDGGSDRRPAPGNGPGGLNPGDGEGQEIGNLLASIDSVLSNPESGGPARSQPQGNAPLAGDTFAGDTFAGDAFAGESNRSGAKPGDAGQADAEPGAAERSDAEGRNAERSDAEPGDAPSSEAGPRASQSTESRSDQSQFDATRPGEPQPDQSQTDQSQTDQSQSDQPQSEAAQSAGVQTDGSRSGESQSGGSRSGGNQSGGSEPDNGARSDDSGRNPGQSGMPRRLPLLDASPWTASRPENGREPSESERKRNRDRPRLLQKPLSSKSAAPGRSSESTETSGQKTSPDLSTNVNTKGSPQSAPSPSSQARSESNSPGRPGSSSGAASSSPTSPTGSAASGASSPARRAADAGMSVPTIRDPQERSVLEPQRRWGSSRPDASLGLEKVALIRVEKGRVVIANQLQVTRRPELSEQQIARRTVLALEQVADKWGWPPPRFYWVPSVKLESEPGEEEMTRLIRRTLLRAGAGMEQGTSKQ